MHKARIYSILESTKAGLKIIFVNSQGLVWYHFDSECKLREIEDMTLNLNFFFFGVIFISTKNGLNLQAKNSLSIIARIRIIHTLKITNL